MSSPEAGMRTLRFDSDVNGIVAIETLPSGILSGIFRIAPLSVHSPLVNCSNRSFVRAGGATFAGFVISGNVPRTVLVRAVGPGLRSFGITDALTDPKISIMLGQREAAQNDDWDVTGTMQGAESVRRTSALVGAFALSALSKDSAIVVQLAPGAYVAQVSGTTTSDSGETLVDVYVLP
jgi:hypothetical protein